VAYYIRCDRLTAMSNTCWSTDSQQYTTVKTQHLKTQDFQESKLCLSGTKIIDIKLNFNKTAAATTFKTKQEMNNDKQ